MPMTAWAIGQSMTSQIEHNLFHIDKKLKLNMKNKIDYLIKINY